MGAADLKSRERYTALVGGVIIVALLVGLRGVPAWMSWRAEARDSASVLRAEAARTAAMYVGFQTILDSLDARLLRLRRVRPIPLVARDTREAESMLATLVTEAARAASVRVASFKVSADSSADARLPRVVITLEATSDVTGLAMLLRELEGSATALTIRSVSVTPQNIQVPAHEVETLAIRIEVEALVLPRDVPRGASL